MKRTRILLMIGLLVLVGMAFLAASPTAEKQYAALQNSDITATSLEDLRKSIDTLKRAVVREQDEAYKNLTQARAKGDRDAYREAWENLDRLASYQMTSAQTDALLQRILALDEPERSEYAAWLYQTSPHYKPSLTLDFSAEDETYSYRYRQQIRREPGSEITLPDSSQIRLNSARLGVLVGWGLTPDEVTYQPGETITMSYTDQTLYAIYQSGVRFVDEMNKTDIFFEEGKVEVPTPTSGDASAIFAGWYDRTTGKLITDPTTYTVEGKGALFEALWKQLAIEDVNVLYYDRTKLPTNTQIGIGFSYTNTGNVNLTGLKATLSSESEYVRMLKGELQLGRLSAGLSSTNNSRFATKSKQEVRGEANTFRFIVSDSAPAGTVLPFTLTITNDRGDSWTHAFELTVR
ncbi:MAG: hypothetical protein AB7D24_09820 [Sphaerochaeta sp.]|uniref:hypothetical protein n=1 Tax=Sphaerochaeta sp. TaxID=1972642 RepID=UPI003D1302EF